MTFLLTSDTDQKTWEISCEEDAKSVIKVIEQIDFRCQGGPWLRRIKAP